MSNSPLYKSSLQLMIMKLTFLSYILALSSVSRVCAQDFTCSATKPCAIGCCTKLYVYQCSDIDFPFQFNVPRDAVVDIIGILVARVA